MKEEKVVAEDWQQELRALGGSIKFKADELKEKIPLYAEEEAKE